jgi:hypothetical protein
MRVHEPPARGDTSGACAHNENLGIAAGHGLFRGDLDRATHRAVPPISVRPVRANTVAALPETATAFCANVKCPYAPSAAGGGNVLRLETLTNTLRKCARNWLLRPTILIIAAFVGFAPAGVVLAQPTENTSPEQGVTCPPDVKGEPPTVGGGSSGALSDKLAQSKGVICPPAGIDRDMQVTPPGGGQLKVIPPPGTPGGDQNVQPK